MTLTSFRLYRVWIGGYWHRTGIGWFPVTPGEWHEQEIYQLPFITDTEDNNTISLDARLIAFAAALLLTVGFVFGFVCL